VDTAGTQIMRGVSLYSFQQAYYLQESTLEQCIATAASLGANGIETLAEQMMPGFPNLSDDFYRQWHRWMAQYGTTPTCHDAFFDVTVRRGEERGHADSVAALKRDIDHADKLGARVIRVLVLTTPAVVEECVPYAAEKRVKLCLEIHSPWHFDDPWIQAHHQVYEKHGPEVVGYVPDMGIFVRKFPRVTYERYLRDGAREEIISHIVGSYDAAAAAGQTLKALGGLSSEVESMGGTALELRAAGQAMRHIWTDPKRLRDFMPYIHHVHAKFWEMTPDGHEYSIPYDELIPVLAEGGYSGYLSSEYEGQRWLQDTDDVDEVEQVRRQQEMFSRILGESA
jgi:sugar phosphate isomerase/epimerase